MARTFILRVENARDRMAAAWHFCREFLEQGQVVQVSVEEFLPTCSNAQKAMFHAICGEIAEQRQWAGRWIDKEGWKRLLVDAWARSEGKQQADLVPSLDGQSIVSLSIQVRSMKVRDMADLITFAQCWAVENDVTLRDVAPLRDQRLAGQAVA